MIKSLVTADVFAKASQKLPASEHARFSWTSINPKVFLETQQIITDALPALRVLDISSLFQFSYRSDLYRIYFFLKSVRISDRRDSKRVELIEQIQKTLGLEQRIYKKEELIGWGESDAFKVRRNLRIGKGFGKGQVDLLAGLLERYPSDVTFRTLNFQEGDAQFWIQFCKHYARRDGINIDTLITRNASVFTSGVKSVNCLMVLGGNEVSADDLYRQITALDIKSLYLCPDYEVGNKSFYDAPRIGEIRHYEDIHQITSLTSLYIVLSRESHVSSVLQLLQAVGRGLTELAFLIPDDLDHYDSVVQAFWNVLGSCRLLRCLWISVQKPCLMQEFNWDLLTNLTSIRINFAVYAALVQGIRRKRGLFITAYWLPPSNGEISVNSLIDLIHKETHAGIHRETHAGIQTLVISDAFTHSKHSDHIYVEPYTGTQQTATRLMIEELDPMCL